MNSKAPRWRSASPPRSRRAAPDGRSRAQDRRQRSFDGFAHLEDGLRDSKRFASAARALAARGLEEAGVTRTRTAIRT